MKKIIIILILSIMTFLTTNVKAANYQIRELIPVNTETTIVTNNFSYKSFYYSNQGNDKNAIIFKSIKNLSDKEKPISISVGLFDKDRKNIGTVNYCSSKTDKSEATKATLAGKTEASYSIEVSRKYLGKNKSLNDIKYISVLSDNINCRTSGSKDYLNQTIEEIGIPKNTTLDSKTELLIKIVGVLAIVIIAIFLYNYLFTNTYQNFNGDDVRTGFKHLNKELKDKREYEERVNPKPKPEKKQEKTAKVLQQEQDAKKESENGTDLHNFYK